MQVATPSETEVDLFYSETLTGRIYMGQRSLYSRKIALWVFLKMYYVHGFCMAPFLFVPSFTHAKILF